MYSFPMLLILCEKIVNLEPFLIKTLCNKSHYLWPKESAESFENNFSNKSGTHVHEARALVVMYVFIPYFHNNTGK